MTRFEGIVKAKRDLETSMNNNICCSKVGQQLSKYNPEIASTHQRTGSGTTNIGYVTTNADAGVGIGMLKGDSEI